MALPRFSPPHDRIPPEGLEGQYGPYIADPRLVHAANTALGLGMPLLLTGDPGSGKSDFAWVLAKQLGHAAPLRCQVRSTTSARELLYHYDALVRFADAQSGDRERAKEPRHYVRLRPLGVALMSRDVERPPVVLLDEIDKAPRDLPNDLLWELDEGRFEIPEIADADPGSDVRDPEHPAVPLVRRMERPAGAKRPLVVITSNSERQLPDAFLRRCVFFHIPTPSQAQLLAIAKARFPGEPPRLLESLVRLFEGLRKEKLTKVPTTSEMLDWLSALTRLHPRREIEAVAEELLLALGEGKPRFHELPALGCLVKLRGDHEQLEPREAREA
jgi:MoxR-like ATPase